MRGHAVVGEQGVQEGAEHASLWDPCVEDQRIGGVSYLHHLGQTQGPSLMMCLMMSLEGTMVLNAEL